MVGHVEDEPQLTTAWATPEDAQDAHKSTLEQLDAIFDTKIDPACLRATFKKLRQGPDESSVQFIQEVRRLARLCVFGAATDVLAFDQVVAGIASPQLQREFFKMGRNFTIQKALDLAREEERVDRTLLHFSSLQVDAISSRPVQDGAGVASTASASSPTGCADTSSPALPSARAGACYRCGSTQHWANSAACPARSRTCSRCGRRGHFARVCRSTTESSAGRQGTSTVTNTVTVLQVDETVNTIGRLRLPVRINNCILSMLIDTGAAVILLNVQDFKSAVKTTIDASCAPAQHECQPKCLICGDDQLTGSAECKEKFRRARKPALPPRQQPEHTTWSGHNMATRANDILKAAIQEPVLGMDHSNLESSRRPGRQNSCRHP
ncbi:hypothetical protein MTO96_036187 [Rhipicephalus appendiculatus]